MGFYVNVQAKPNCANQINTLWKEQFDGFLIYTSSIIRKEIAYIKKNNQMPHLHNHLNNTKDWNKLFPIFSSGKGQVFLRAVGYSEEEANEFQAENKELKSKVKFLLDNRFLFKKITGLSDANDVFPDLNINGEYMENGKLKFYDEPCFSKLPAKPKNKIYNYCLERNKPNIWQAYNNILENGLNFKNWLEIRNFCFNGILSETIWQKCEAIYCAANNVESNLEGHFNTENKKIPTLNDINNAILLNKEDFEKLLFSYKNIENALIVNF